MPHEQTNRMWELNHYDCCVIMSSNCLRHSQTPDWIILDCCIQYHMVSSNKENIYSTSMYDDHAGPFHFRTVQRANVRKSRVVWRVLLFLILSNKAPGTIQEKQEQKEQAIFEISEQKRVKVVVKVALVRRSVLH